METTMRRIIRMTLMVSLGLAVPLGASLAQASTAISRVDDEAAEAWAKIRGAWTQMQGTVKEQWGSLTNDDVAEINGRREQLIGAIQTRYGVSREEAERQVSRWEDGYR
jgi:uncharacterized protein YjbJ (UPF0337 family)